MQTTLLGIALALIAAILAAFAAPLFIDWNEWRPELETQASALAGTRVTISGNIDLTLLPTPAFVLREVSLGDPEKGTGIRASEMRGSLSLPALLTGKIEASAFVLSRPALRLVIDEDGRLSLPAGAGTGQEVSVASFVLEAGSITIEDRRTDSLLAADDFSARGELLSREGPFRLDGGFRLNGMRWILRASASRFGADQTGKARLSLERPADNVSFDADGALSLANAAPRFDGRVMISQRSGALPWRVSADVAGDAGEVRLTNLDLALGRGELPITLSGDATLTPRAGGTIDATLTSKRIDLDLGDPKAGATGAAHVLPLLSEARLLFSALPLVAKLVVSADGVLAGGQLVRDIRAEFVSRGGAVALERLEARMPGRTMIAVSGKNERGQFSGPLSFEAEEPQIFARWLLGAETAEKLAIAKTLRLNGELSISPKLTAIRKLDAQIGDARIGGAISLHPAGADLKLTLRGAEIDALLPLMKDIGGFAKGTDVAAEIEATGVVFLKTSVKRALLKAKHSNDAFTLEHLEIGDFDGTSLTVKRTAQENAFSAEVVRSGGLVTLLNYFSGSSDLAALAGKYASPHLPLRLSGTIAPRKDGWRLTAKSGEAAWLLDVSELRDARREISVDLRLPDTEVGAKGALKFSTDGRVDPAFALTVRSSDLRKAVVQASQASAIPLPVSGSAKLGRDGNNFVFENIAVDFAGSRVTGRTAFPEGEISPYTGSIAIDRLSATTLLALALGRADDESGKLTPPVLTTVPGTLQLSVGSLELSERLSIRNAAFELRAGRLETVLESFRGELAGGKVTGSLRVTDTDPRVAELKAVVVDATLAQLFSTEALNGKTNFHLALSATGSSPRELLLSLAGQGKIVLSPLEIARADATAVSAVLASASQRTPDEVEVQRALVTALDRASLRVSKLETPLVVANGVVRSGSAKAQAGNIEIALSGSLNIPARSAETALQIELTKSGAARPGATVRWTGPLEKMERSVDAKALIAAIAVQAIERGERAPRNLDQRPDESVAPSKKKRQPARKDIETAPLLPPPAEVPSAPQPRSQN